MTHKQTGQQKDRKKDIINVESLMVGCKKIFQSHQKPGGKDYESVAIKTWKIGEVAIL